MSRVNATLAAMLIVAGGLVAGCGDNDAPPATSSVEPSPSTSAAPLDTALVTLAHTTVLRKAGRDSEFDQETVSNVSGSPVACGRFINRVKSVRGYYIARAGDAQVFWDAKPPVWEQLCGKGSSASNSPAASSERL